MENIKILKQHPEAFERWKAEIAARTEKPIFPTRPVVNPERRKERLVEQLKDAPEKHYEPRTRLVRITEATDYVRHCLKELYTIDQGDMFCQICEQVMLFKKHDGQYYFEAVEALSKDHFPIEHQAQFLALCPLCAARFKEFVKRDPRAMDQLSQALKTYEKSSDEIKVSLNLGELQTSIRFVESHWQVIKTILQEKG